MDFREYIVTKVLKKNDRILEFGPLIRPLVSKKDYPNIFFADIKNTEEIKKLYTSNDYLKATGLSVDINSVVEIDYVITKSYTETFKHEKKFDVVYLSHVIEHMPDIITFLEDVANIIKSDGKLVLIYPDARYCFDHFRNGTSFIDAYDVYKDTKSSSKRVFDFVYNVVRENNPFFFWGDPKQNKILPENDFKKALQDYEKAKKNELPDDTHFWPFADYQFIKFLYDADRAGLLKFDIDIFHPTQENTQEFMIILKPKSGTEVDTAKYKQILNRVSPAIKDINSRSKISELENELAALAAKNQELNSELTEVYESKKWKYATKAANIKSKLSISNVKK
jgi:SAM-dependent methyltransferase